MSFRNISASADTKEEAVRRVTNAILLGWRVIEDWGPRLIDGLWHYAVRTAPPEEKGEDDEESGQ